MAETAYPENVSYKDHVMFNKEELDRRLQSRLHMPGADTWRRLGTLNYTDPVAIIDAGIGFHARTLRLFLQRLAPPNAGVTTGPSMWKSFGHRHTCEAVIYFLTGEGYSIIDGVRYDWKAGDFLCVPVFAWHRHVNTTDEPVVYVAGVTVPFSKAVGLSVFEDELYPDEWIFAQKGDEAMGSLIPGVAEGAPPPDAGAVSEAERIYRRELRYAHEEEARRRDGRVLVPAADVTFQETSLGSMAVIADPLVGFNLKVMATYLLDVPPGGASTLHRHTYEEACYFLAGEGLSIIADNPVRWTAGDAVYVPPFEWHEHVNQGQEAVRILVHTNRPLTEGIGLALTQHYAAD
jgi:gentisate 1,2-dioxygenase